MNKSTCKCNNCGHINRAKEFANSVLQNTPFDVLDRAMAKSQNMVIPPDAPVIEPNTIFIAPPKIAEIMCKNLHAIAYGVWGNELDTERYMRAKAIAALWVFNNYKEKKED